MRRTCALFLVLLVAGCRADMPRRKRKIEDDPVDARKSTRFDMGGSHRTEQYHGGDDFASFPRVFRRGLMIELPPLDISSLGISLLECGVSKDIADLRFPDRKDCVPETPVEWDSSDSNPTATRIAIPTDAAVGTYHLTSTSTTFDFAVIFNPYSGELRGLSHQSIYEYVFRTDTVIWQNDAFSNEANVWRVDQFHPAALITALSLLHALTPEERASPVTVSRELSHRVNEELCYGLWNEQRYEMLRPKGGYACRANDDTLSCRDPSNWRDSTDILEQHWRIVRLGRKYTRVQFCQCFVFAGLLTTMGRTLGIPSRPVTNFCSAHDTNRDRALSLFFDEDSAGNWSPAVDYTDADPGSQDSMWEFHVWTEMYMNRPDIGKVKKVDSSGWQVVDATNQDRSHGLFQLGPASVSLVSHNIDECFDNEFVITEVKAGINLYVRKPSSDKYVFQWTAPADPFNENNRPGISTVTMKEGCDLSSLNVGVDCRVELASAYRRVNHAGTPSKKPHMCKVIGEDDFLPVLDFEESSELRDARVLEELLGERSEEDEEEEDEEEIDLRLKQSLYLTDFHATLHSPLTESRQLAPVSVLPLAPPHIQATSPLQVQAAFPKVFVGVASHMTVFLQNLSDRTVEVSLWARARPLSQQGTPLPYMRLKGGQKYWSIDTETKLVRVPPSSEMPSVIKNLLNIRISRGDLERMAFVRTDRVSVEFSATVVGVKGHVFVRSVKMPVLF